MWVCRTENACARSVPHTSLLGAIFVHVVKTEACVVCTVRSCSSPPDSCHSPNPLKTFHFPPKPIFNPPPPHPYIQAIWLRKAGDISEEEYNKFYKAVSKVNMVDEGLALHCDQGSVLGVQGLRGVAFTPISEEEYNKLYKAVKKVM